MVYRSRRNYKDRQKLETNRDKHRRSYHAIMPLWKAFIWLCMDSRMGKLCLLVGVLLFILDLWSPLPISCIPSRNRAGISWCLSDIHVYFSRCVHDRGTKPENSDGRKGVRENPAFEHNWGRGSLLWLLKATLLMNDPWAQKSSIEYWNSRHGNRFLNERSRTRCGIPPHLFFSNYKFSLPYQLVPPWSQT